MINRFFTYPKTSNITKDGLYREYNQWGCDDLDDSWFVKFLRHNFPDNKKIVNFFGPLGKPFYIRNKFDGIKVFYTAEDVEHKWTKLNLFYGDYCLKYVDLALGFGNINGSKYMRFPYWIKTTFEPTFNESDIIARIKQINRVNYIKSNFCVLINKHDKKGTREMIYNDVKKIMDVKLAGQWKNNTTDLWEKYNNNKFEYLKTFKFNICPENDNTENYVTEKLFDAFIAGCIPLYYGSNNNPEPGIINKNAVIFWNKEDNRKNIELVDELNKNDKLYLEFTSQEKLTPLAVEYVVNRFEQLKDHFKRLIIE